MHYLINKPQDILVGESYFSDESCTPHISAVVRCYAKASFHFELPFGFLSKSRATLGGMTKFEISKKIKCLGW
ncbi:MAG: hypothetical protein HOE90_22420 [Bacteriovoracaceae bacterium]|jgi:hypothetical protein|nr:hypothetical protein [Bacteriovoracaceae bacterium]